MKPPDYPGLSVRLAALHVLQEHERSGAFLKDLFPAALADLAPVDKGLARALALGVLRHRTWLDHHLDALAPKGIASPELRQLLRIAAAQLLLLDQIPAHAAVDTAVEIASRRFGKSQAGFANALLKNVARQGRRTLNEGDTAGLALATSHPAWLVERWRRILGHAAAAKALHRNNEEPPIWLRVNPLRTTVEAAQAELQAAGLAPGLDAEAPLFLRLDGGAEPILQMPLFAEGGISFQDPAAYFVARLLDWHPQHRTLDLCAAPGGKAALLLAMAAKAGEPLDQARLVCADLSWRRLRAVHDVKRRLGHTGAFGELWPVVQDALKPALKRPRATDGGPVGFDRILADVPCSNLGVIGRRPEARWRLKESDLQQHGKRQLALLKQAAELLAPGGRLVYATCSPEREETREVVQRFLAARPDFALADAADCVPERLTRQGCLHLFPGETDYDGFFGAALMRQG